MNPETSGGLPPEIDPKKLVVQEGEDKGRIADVELAQVGAEREDAERETAATINEKIESGTISSSFRKNTKEEIVDGGDRAGHNAMVDEVRLRAAEITPMGADDRTKNEIANAAAQSFGREVHRTSDERRIEDEAKAQELLARIRGEKKE
jgi:hypothetical protein